MPSSLILAAIGYTAAEIGAVTFSMLATRFAINFAVSLIVTRAFSSGNANKNVDNGVRQQVPPATTNSIPIVYGDAYLGGVFVDAVLSTDQKTMYYVLAISNISPNGQFSFDTNNMYWQDQTIVFDSTDKTKVIKLIDGAGNEQVKISGNLYINLYTSDESGNIVSSNGAAAPTTVMGGSDIAVAQRWVSTTLAPRKMNGLAFAIVKMIYNRDAGTTQMQPVTFRASHYLKNTGAAKPGDVWYDYITNAKYGCSMDASIVDATTATALNTYSDQTITYTPAAGGSSTQPRYRINGVIDTGQDVLSNLDNIMLACDSWNQYNAATGKWSIVINKADSASFAFDDSNIVGEIRVSAFDISASINQIQAQFPSKLNRDQSDYVYLNTPPILLFANEPVNKYSVSLNLVNDSVQAQYLANRMLEQAREDLIVTFATTYNGIQVDAGDVISVTNSAYGWTNKLFRVIKVSEASLPDGNLGASLELNEYNAGVYDDASITAFSPTPNSNLSNPNFFSNLTAPTVANINTTATIPHFDVVCGVPATGRVTQITLFYTNVSSPSTTDWKVWGVQTASNSQPFSPSTNVTFTDINLPTDTYYFAFKVENESGASALSASSTGFTWSPNPTTSAVAGTFLATFSPVVMQVPRNSSLVPSFTGLITQLYGSAAGGAIDFVTSQTDADSLFVNNTWRIGASSTTGYGDITTTSGLVLGSLTDGGTFAQWGIPTAMTSSPATLTVPVRYKSALGVVTQGATAILQYVFVDQGATGSPGTNGTQAADVTLYQWSTSTPSNPSGTSTYTWATAINSGYTGGGGWTTTIPTNPGTAGIQLWTAVKPTVVTVGTTTTTVSWTSGYTIASVTANGANGANGTNGTNGANGLQTARPTVYQWALTLPSGPTGTSTYTWSTNSFTPNPSGWSQTITSSPSVGYTLWAATVNISDTATATTTTINWGLAGIIASGYAGTNGSNGTNGTNGTNGAPGANGIDGLSSRICYAKSTSTSLNSTPTYYVTTGAGAFPPTNTWGGAETWVATPPTISAGEALFQSDGIYNPGTTQTTWNVPYLSNLKVGSLSAITANTGNLTVSGTIQSNTAAISGTTMTGSGAVIYSSGNFAVGNASNNITYNGSAITLNGTVVFPANINSNNLTLKDGSGNVILGNGTPLNYSNITPASAWLNSNITISSGAISGIGTGSGTIVDNTSIYISGGTINGIGSGTGTAVANSAISVSGGTINGIGTGNGTAVANNAITINSNGTLSGAGSGQVTIGGLGYTGAIDATRNVTTYSSTTPSSPQNGDIWVDTSLTPNVTKLYSGGAWQTAASYGAAFGTNIYGQITAGNASTYIGSAAIGSALVGVLQAGNIGAGQIDASKINVSNLSAISANLGTVTAGAISGASLTVGTSPAVSGTTMTGAGAVINTTGTFALGNSSTNISYDGSQMTLNGNVVSTGNINLNAATITAYTQLNSSLVFGSSTTGDVLTQTVNTGGQPILVIYQFSFTYGYSASAGQIDVQVKINGIAVKQRTYSISSGAGASTAQGVAYLANPSTSNFVVSITLSTNTWSSTVSFLPVSATSDFGNYFYVLGTKR